MQEHQSNTSDVAQIIGESYLTGSFSTEGHPMVEEAYRRIAKLNRILYDQIPVPVIWTHDDPYGSYEEMRHKVDTNEELLVFAGGSKPKYMSQEDNVKGRAVHDYFGHLRHDVDFSIEGEFRKWFNARKHYPACDDVGAPVHRLLFTEIVGQRCVAEILDGGFDNEQFTQRAVPAPKGWIRLCADAFLTDDESL